MSKHSSLELYVDRWSAWEPRAIGPARSYSGRVGHYREIGLDKPELRQVPPLQRRRLGALARVVFHVLGDCVPGGGCEPVVFSSLMGEIQRTQELLDAIASDAPVSPAAFSLSVHNAIAGLWTLVHGIEAPMVALSPVHGSPLAALWEAAGILLESDHNAVTVVCYEEAYPDFYSPWLTGPPAPCALALRLVSAGTVSTPFSAFTLTRVATSAREGANGPLSLLPLMCGDFTSISLCDQGGNWELERRE